MIDPLILAAPFGMLVSIFYLFLLTKTRTLNFESHFATVFGLYLAFIGIFIAFYGIYVEKTLILDIDTFMNHIIEDMNGINSRFFWCYPGLSFGSISSSGDRYEKFREMLYENVFMNKKITKEIFAFDEDEIKSFYKPYMRNAEQELRPEKRKDQIGKVRKAIRDSIRFIKICRWGQGETIDRRSEVKILDILSNLKQGESINNFRVGYYYKTTDAYLRFEIIIVDDNVYILTPFGLPQKFNHFYEFTHDVNSEHPVNFHVTRVISKNSADTLINQIRTEYNKIEKIKLTQQEEN